MGQAEDFRDRLWDETYGYRELASLVNENPRDEMLFLEFKSGKELFRSGSLDGNNVKGILSKAVSAFANASGGIIVWGVADWEKTRKKKPKLESFDLAQAEELCAFVKRVHLGATLPPPPDIWPRITTETCP